MLPLPLQALHQVIDLRRWQGEAKVTPGTGRLSCLIFRLFGCPAATETAPVEATMERVGTAERWARRFGTFTFPSTLRPRGNKMTKRFCLCIFTLRLAVKGGSLIFPVMCGRLGPVRFPRAIPPRSDAVETVADTLTGPRTRV